MTRVLDEDRVHQVHSSPAMEAIFIERACTKCGIVKLYDSFSFCSRSAADKRNGVRRKKRECRSCASIYTLAYRQFDLTRARKNERIGHYTRKYGLSRNHATILAEPENRKGRCPICGEVDYLVMDHHHATNQTREMICSSCNSAIGYSRESIDALYNMIAYLKKHRGV